MVVSGMHLSISVLFFAGPLSRIWYNRFVKAFTMLSVVLILTALCGFSVSILRAGVTYIIAAVMLMLNCNSLSENNLGGAVAIILMVNPLMVFSGAFWLSVLSTFGILCVAKYVLAALERTRLYYCTPIFALISAAVITLSATLLTLPVTIYLFGEISLVGVITNILISYAVTVSLWLSVTGVLINLVLPVIAKGICFITEPIVVYFNAVITYFGSLPFAVVTVPKETAFLALALIVAVFWGILHLSERKYNRLLKEKGIKTEKEIKKNKGKEGFKINV
jgi:competence protein ComEC